MSTEEVRKMKVYIDGKEEERPISYINCIDMRDGNSLLGFHQSGPLDRFEMPVLRPGEEMYRTVDGKIHIIKGQIR